MWGVAEHRVETISLHLFRERSFVGKSSDNSLGVALSPIHPFPLLHIPPNVLSHTLDSFDTFLLSMRKLLSPFSVDIWNEGYSQATLAEELESQQPKSKTLHSGGCCILKNSETGLKKDTTGLLPWIGCGGC